jgi:dTDP-4-amino-4,6-dideoxygalactose transaminase
MIPISKPFFNEYEKKYINKVINSKILVDGPFQSKVEKIIKKKIGSKSISLTQSCTHALEITSILLNIKKNDEIIMPSYGYVSLGNAIVLRGGKPVFAEIDPDTLNINPKDIEKKITKKTKAIYIIHYGGNACDMEEILKIKKKYNLFLIEDAAHAFLGKYKNRYLGTIGDIGVFSFHETKNITGGQAGCISINNKKFLKRKDFILDKGTNRRHFIKNFRKKIISSSQNKKFYSWVDIGSEYRASEISSALIYSQLKKINYIQNKRKLLFNDYLKLFKKINSNTVKTLTINNKNKSAFHLFVLIFKDQIKAKKFIAHLQRNDIAATFHYVPLHKSKMGRSFTNKRLLITEKIYMRIVRIPFFCGLKYSEIKKIKKIIYNFFKNKDFNN